MKNALMGADPKNSLYSVIRYSAPLLSVMQKGQICLKRQKIFLPLPHKIESANSKKILDTPLNLISGTSRKLSRLKV